MEADANTEAAIDFFDDLTGWKDGGGSENESAIEHYYFHVTNSGYYIIQVYYEKTNGYVFINAGIPSDYMAIECQTYADAKEVFAVLTGVTLPDYEGAEIGETGCSFQTGTYGGITFSFTATTFTQATAEEVEGLFTTAFGEPSDSDHTDVWITSWTYEGKMYSVEWIQASLTIDINVSPAP